MTSEIVIGNGFGLVLCADTATTRGRTRTYDGARKLIGLPMPHRIGVLHAGMVTFHGVPYETLLENWIHALPAQRFARLSDYAESFSDYLKECVSTFLSDTEASSEYLRVWRHRLWKMWSYLRDNDLLSDAEIAEYFSHLVDKYSEDDINHGRNFANAVFDAVGRGSRRNLLEAECVEAKCNDLTHSSLEGAVDRYFAETASPATLDLIYRWVRYFSGLMHPCDSDDSATIVFAGFAEKDALPALVEISVEAVFLGRLFADQERMERAQRNPGGFTLFRTFGQSNEIWRFIREAGLNPHYHEQVVKSSFSNLEGESHEAVEEEEHNGNPLSDPDERIGRVHSEITDELRRLADENIGSAMSSFASMNLMNLAAIANRLVLLQNLSLDLRGELPTVGGSLVTATVTLQHGFSIYSGGDNHKELH